jgi:hypothetical protein
VITTNLNLVRSAVTKQTANLDVAARLARNEMMMAMIQLSKKEIQGKRKEGEKATAGEPPKNRTGNLRRSIKGQPINRGYAKYVALVGPTMVYSRAVELGGAYAPSSWYGTTAMAGFPYMKPAFKKFTLGGVQNRIIIKHLARFL